MNRLLSVNVGGPREVRWKGETVRTAIWKEPVTGPRMVRRLNIDGDDQADREAHGGEHRAVFVYQIASYRYWEKELGRDDFAFGQFGENLTVDGLGDDEVCIGDRYRIGGALLEVTQPRVTCYRLGIRMDEPRMPSLVVAHHRPGFYVRVIEEGEIAAGDAITKVAAGPEGLTVADIDALLYLPGRSPRTLARALRIPALSEGWRGSFRDLLADGGSETAGAVAPTPAWAGFRPLRVVAVTPESPDVTSLRLAPEPGDAPVGTAALPGQYLTLRLQPDDPGAPPLLRSYSLSSVPDAEGYRISVKREPRGAASALLHDRVHVGDLIAAAAPRGDFVLRDGEGPVVLLSAGIGATPVLAMLHDLARRRDSRPVWWVHGARNGREHAFATEAAQLVAGLPDGHRLVCLSAPDPTDDAGAAFDARGRIDATALDRAGVPVAADHYVCGPEGFMSGLGAVLVARGVAPERIHTEAFGPAAGTTKPGALGGAERPLPHPPAGTQGAGPAVVFSRSGLTVSWNADFGSLLDLAEACDVPVGFGCRSGVCHSCESGVLSGAVSYTAAPLENPPAGRALLCIATPAEELALDL